MPGIPRNPTQLIARLRAAATAIPSAPFWPATAPGIDELNTQADLQEADDVTVESSEDQFRIDRQKRRDDGAVSYEMMQRVDRATDVIYGPTSMLKTPFGVDPAQEPGGGPPPPPLEKPIIEKIEDGVTPGSIFVDWANVQGAVSYEIQWFTDSGMTQMVGQGTSTASKFTIHSLTKGTQYWIRLRAVRASNFGPYSDPATRVANV